MLSLENKKRLNIGSENSMILEKISSKRADRLSKGIEEPRYTKDFFDPADPVFTTKTTGLFWLNNKFNRVIAKKVALASNGEELLGNMITIEDDHSAFWGIVQKEVIVKYGGDPNSYLSLPRGRINYDYKTNKQIVWARSWIRRNGTFNAIIEAFDLPQQITKIRVNDEYDYSLDLLED
jgi:hypothetical protein